MAVVLLLALAALGASAPASAQSGDAAVCSARKGAPSVEACTRLIEAGTSKGVALYVLHNDRGGAHQSKGADADHRLAVDDFTRAITLDAKLPFAYINRGVSWATLGAFDRAIDDFAQALKVDPRNARAFNNRGGAHRDRGDFERAMADFNRALALDPKLIDALFNRGTLHMQKEDYPRAIADYSAVLRQSPKDILALAARGRAWASRDDDVRARADFEAAIAAPAEDAQSRTVQEAVRELLRALIERRAAVERETQQQRQAEAEKKAEEARLAARAKQEAATQKAEQERLAAVHRKEAVDKKAAEEKQAALQRKDAADKKAAEEKQAALQRKDAADKKATDEKQASEKRAAEERLAAVQRRQAAEKRANEERIAALQPPPPTTDAPRRGERMALVIGNAAYHPSLGRLENSGHDAVDVAKGLRQLGFVVWFGLDLGHVEMKALATRFADTARDAQTALVFFSGHGFQHGSANYLAPVDAAITDDASIANHLSLDDVMASLRAEQGARILIIDACRNNLAVEQAAGAPEPQAPAQTAGLSRSLRLKRGLSQMSNTTAWPGGGMLIAFATLPGEIASDGAGRNSPFTHALVKHLQTPDLELRHLFIRVRAEVIAATHARQIPQVSDALNGEYVFNVRRRR